jgi:Na+-driven multidrug efflux pump
VSSDSLNWPYALICGGITVAAGYVGITSVNNYIKKTGKQSLIAVILTCVLVFALLSLPLDMWLDWMYIEDEEKMIDT